MWADPTILTRLEVSIPQWVSNLRGAVLSLRKGKLAAQVAHAAVGAFVCATVEVQAAWLESGMPKIVVGVTSADELLRLHAAAERLGIPACLVRDTGKTAVPPGTLTCLGLGPAPAELLDSLTGDLRLL